MNAPESLKRNAIILTALALLGSIFWIKYERNHKQTSLPVLTETAVLDVTTAPPVDQEGSQLPIIFLDADFTDERLAEVAAEANKTLPKDVSPNVRLDNITTGHLILQYNNTLVTVNKSDLSDSLIAEMKVQVPISVCSDAKLYEVLRHNMTLVYSYKDVAGINLGNIEVNLKSCNPLGG